MVWAMQSPTMRYARLRRTLLLLGPAFVAAVAYVDPGNVAPTSLLGRSTATCCSGSSWSRT